MERVMGDAGDCGVYGGRDWHNFNSMHGPWIDF